MKDKANIITVVGIECPVCLDEIWSRHRHDFRYCTCSYCFVDGGRDYLRYGWGIDGDTSAGPPSMVDMEVRVMPNKVRDEEFWNSFWSIYDVRSLMDRSK